MDQKRLLELAGVTTLTEKVNPDAEYPIATITCAQIAKLVNETIEEKRLNIAMFEPNDPRLTPKFCRAFSQHMMDWHEGFQSTWLHNNEMWEQVADFIGEVGQQYLRTVPSSKPKKKPTSSEKK